MLEDPAAEGLEAEESVEDIVAEVRYGDDIVVDGIGDGAAPENLDTADAAAAAAVGAAYTVDSVAEAVALKGSSIDGR